MSERLPPELFTPLIDRKFPAADFKAPDLHVGPSGEGRIPPLTLLVAGSLSTPHASPASKEQVLGMSQMLAAAAEKGDANRVGKLVTWLLRQPLPELGFDRVAVLQLVSGRRNQKSPTVLDAALSRPMPDVLQAYLGAILSSRSLSESEKFKLLQGAGKTPFDSLRCAIELHGYTARTYARLLIAHRHELPTSIVPALLGRSAAAVPAVFACFRPGVADPARDDRVNRYLREIYSSPNLSIAQRKELRETKHAMRYLYQWASECGPSAQFAVMEATYADPAFPGYKGLTAKISQAERRHVAIAADNSTWLERLREISKDSNFPAKRAAELASEIGQGTPVRLKEGDSKGECASVGLTAISFDPPTRKLVCVARSIPECLAAFEISSTPHVFTDKAFSPYFNIPPESLTWTALDGKSSQPQRGAKAAVPGPVITAWPNPLSHVKVVEKAWQEGSSASPIQELAAAVDEARSRNDSKAIESYVSAVLSSTILGPSVKSLVLRGATMSGFHWMRVAISGGSQWPVGYARQVLAHWGDLPEVNRVAALLGGPPGGASPGLFRAIEESLEGEARLRRNAAVHDYLLEVLSPPSPLSEDEIRQFLTARGEGRTLLEVAQKSGREEYFAVICALIEACPPQYLPPVWDSLPALNSAKPGPWEKRLQALKNQASLLLDERRAQVTQFERAGGYVALKGVSDDVAASDGLRLISFGEDPIAISAAKPPPSRLKRFAHDGASDLKGGPFFRIPPRELVPRNGVPSSFRYAGISWQASKNTLDDPTVQLTAAGAPDQLTGSPRLSAILAEASSSSSEGGAVRVSIERRKLLALLETAEAAENMAVQAVIE